MSEHRYPRSVLLADLLRGTVGLSVCVAVLLVVQPVGWLALVLLLFAALFAFYVCRVLFRCRYRIEMDSHSLRVFFGAKPRSAVRCLEWSQLDRLDLDYFCTRRDGRGGWLQLRLRTGSGIVRVDSRLQGFELVLAHAVDTARRYGVALSAATTSNLLAIGFDDEFD